MYDNALYFSEFAEKKSDILKQYGLSAGNYMLATIHRDNNTDDPERFASIFLSLNKISLENKLKVVLPLHPRTSKALQSNLKKVLCI